MKLITVDGEAGGGQILRSSLTLSLLTGRPFRLINIRGKRSNPGLQRQHLACVHASAEISDAATDGAEMGSRELVFRPGTIRGGSRHWRIGSAGSTMLVFQTILLPLALRSEEGSSITIEGGTHNPLAPPYDFIDRVYLPHLRTMGIQSDLNLEKHGFYPAGGGRMEAEITPAKDLQPLNLLNRPETLQVHAKALCAHVPESIGEREATAAGKVLRHGLADSSIEVIENSDGPGNVLMLEATDGSQVFDLVTTFGERGRSAESVGKQAARGMATYLASAAPVGVHLADQLLLPLALAGGSFRTLPLSDHSQSHLTVIDAFLNPTVTISDCEQGVCEICMKPSDA